MKITGIDAYIEKSQPFAKPILIKLRELVHKACPDVQELIKWSMPAFDYKGPMLNMAAFKHHCVFGFWKGQLLKDPGKYLQERATNGGDSMGQLGKITSLKDLPPDKVMIDFIKQAMKLNEDGIKVEKKKPAPGKQLEVPDVLSKALNKNKVAKMHFEEFSPSARKEYIEWINDAKTEATRLKRLTTAIEWIVEGKRRNWKYEKKS
jgi:uncharacterized protein YdeI (YjbR/CyaY-like superfamily)